jgi:CBS domain containing-hemolysin-like protein
MAEDGRGGARTALALAEDPTRVLATVQVGMTLTQTLASTFSGGTLADPLEDRLASFPISRDVGGRTLSAIQISTAAAICTALDLLATGQVPQSGFNVRRT